MIFIPSTNSEVLGVLFACFFLSFRKEGTELKQAKKVRILQLDKWRHRHSAIIIEMNPHTCRYSVSCYSLSLLI